MCVCVCAHVCVCVNGIHGCKQSVLIVMCLAFMHLVVHAVGSKTLSGAASLPYTPIHENCKIATVLFNICTNHVGNKSLVYGRL